jgi:hypothetical protein
MITADNPTAQGGISFLRTRWLAISALCLLSFTFLITLTEGCGPSERQRVQTVSDQFLEAMSQKDWGRAKPLLTEKARDAMGSINPFAQSETDKAKPDSNSPISENYTLGEPKIEETQASIPVTLTREGHTNLGILRLRREDGEWHVRALRIEGENDAPGITLDFENPQTVLFDAAFRAIGEGVGEMLKGLGKGMGAFMEGLEKGAAAMEKASETASPSAVETPEPAPSPDSSGSGVKIEEHTGGN